MQPKLKAAIIGAGSIGGLIDTPNSNTIASHAHAYSICKETQLIAFCEPNDTQAKLFCENWGDIPRYRNVDEMLKNETLDIVSIASPTALHVSHLLQLLENKNISHILCEKPLTDSIKTLNEIQEHLNQSSKKVLINFIRHYDPSTLQLAQMIRNGTLGKVIEFSAVCTKGLLHNGAHMLDMLTLFFDDINTITAVEATSNNNDLCGSFHIKTAQTNGLLHVLAHPEYSLFELQIWGENGMVKITQGGAHIEMFSSKPSAQFQGYNVLESDTTLTNSLEHYALHTLEFLIHTDALTCKRILHKQIALHETLLHTIESIRHG